MSDPCGASRGAAGRAAVAKGAERPAWPCKARTACTVRLQGLNLELLETQCQVRDALFKAYNQLRVAAL